MCGTFLAQILIFLWKGQMKYARWHTYSILSPPHLVFTRFLFFSTSSHLCFQNSKATELKQSKGFTFSRNHQGKQSTFCIKYQAKSAGSGNSNSSKMLFPLRFLWQHPLQGRHVQVVACHRFSGPARVLKLCCVRVEVVSLLDEVQ